MIATLKVTLSNAQMQYIAGIILVIIFCFILRKFWSKIWNKTKDVIEVLIPVMIIMIILTPLGVTLYLAAVKQECKQTATNITEILARKLTTVAVQKDLPISEETVEIPLSNYIDPWEQPYIARFASTSDYVKVVVLSRGKNKVVDKTEMIMLGPEAGKYKYGDDIIGMDMQNRPKPNFPKMRVPEQDHEHFKHMVMNVIRKVEKEQKNYYLSGEKE